MYNRPTKLKNKFIIDDDEEDTVACRVCTKSFITETALNNHARMEHIELYNTGKKEEWTRYLQEPAPIKVRSRKNRSPIKETDKKEKSDNERRGQKKEVQPIVGPFECLQPSNIGSDKICHQFFFSCCEYSSHYRDEHTRKRKALRCQVCEKSLPNPNNPDACNLRVNGHQTSEQLQAHISEAHVKPRPFECNVCGKRFIHKIGVREHMRLHTGDKLYCTFCPKSFSQKSGLVQHLRIHTKERPYRCVICSKTYPHSVHLKQHMRTHTNISQFQCGICQKGFKQRKHLDHHLIHHDLTNLTEEQKKKYSELIELIRSGLTTEDMEQDETHEALVVLENQEVFVVSEVYESEYELGTENVWNCET